jgi:hypothetical protein
MVCGPESGDEFSQHHSAVKQKAGKIRWSIGLSNKLAFSRPVNSTQETPAVGAESWRISLAVDR